MVTQLPPEIANVNATQKESPPTSAPHVKVLSDQVSDQVKLVDEEGGIIRLVDEELSYPTIRESDVVIGANGLVPPMKVTELAREEGDLVLSVVAALPKEVIEYGTATFEQTIDWSGSSGEVTIVDIPGEPYHIAEDLEPKWEGFVQAGDPIQTGLKVTASAELDWTPTYTGSIEFDRDINSGLKLFNIEHSESILAKERLEIEGDHSLFERLIDIGDFLPGYNKRISVPLGPVQVYIRVESHFPLKMYSMASMLQRSVVGLNYSINIKETISYNPAENVGWTHTMSKESNSQDGIFQGIENMIGGYFLALSPQVSVSLFDNISSTSGLRFDNLLSSLVFQSPELESSSSEVELLGTINNTQDGKSWNWGGVQYFFFEGGPFLFPNAANRQANTQLINATPPPIPPSDPGVCDDKFCPPWLKGLLGFVTIFFIVSCPKLPPIPDPVTVICYTLLFAFAAIYYILCDLPRSKNDVTSLFSSSNENYTVDSVQDRLSDMANQMSNVSGMPTEILQSRLDQFLADYGSLSVDQLLVLADTSLKTFINQNDLSGMPGAEEFLGELSRALQSYVNL